MMAMQMIEKTPWSKDGQRHAHVEFQVEVPSVIPAASRPPTLLSMSAE